MSIKDLLQKLQEFLLSVPLPQDRTHLYDFQTSTDFHAYLQQQTNKVINIIISIVEAASIQQNKDELNPMIQRFMTVLEFKLKFLAKDAQQLINQGIISGHMDLCELYEQSLGKIPGFLSQMTKNMIGSMRGLLKVYFIAQEFRKKHNNQSIQFIENDLFRSISQQIEQMDLKSLIEQQVCLLVRQQQGEYQLCRMCSCQIKLSMIKEHVMICKKAKTLKQQIDQVSDLIYKKAEQIKEICQKVHLKRTKSLGDQRLVKLGKMLQLVQRKKQKVHERRCSLVSKNQSLEDKFEKYLQEFLEEFDEHQPLTQLLQALRKKTKLQKKFSQTHNTQRSPLKQQQRLNILVPQPSILKKSSGDCQEKNKKAASDNQSSSSDNQNKQETSLKCISLYKSQKKSINCKSQMSVGSVQNIKLYRSLQDFVSKEQSLVNIDLNSFDILKVLGQGAFGKVYLTRRKHTQDLYALKAIKLSQGDKDEMQSIKNQHQIFKKIEGDHLVKAPFSFSTQGGHIFVLEYMCGGDLKKLLNEEVYFQEDTAKAYLAEIVLAIEHLHLYQIIHRDLKPENLVIDKNGHLKLTDFGLSQIQIQKKLAKSKEQEEEVKGKKLRRRRAGMCGGDKKKMKLIGTPDYIAPEIINSVSQSNYSIDWWSLGVMAYELLIGARPFCADTIQQVIDNISNFAIQWPQVGQEEGMISPEAKDFISQLLNKNFMQRLGAKGASQIKQHPFFDGIDWDHIKSTRLMHVPNLSNMTEYFQMAQQKQLRTDLQKFLKGQARCKTMKLNNFVRFDLLEAQTLQQSHRTQEQHQRKLKKLKTLSRIAVEEYLID